MKIIRLEGVNQLSEEEKNKFNSQTSHWTIRGYLYPNIAEELKITGFTACKEYYEQKDEPIAYFTVNPNLDSNQEIKISPYLEFIIDSYFSLCDEEKELVRQCIGLLYEGIELFNTNRSVSLLSIPRFSIFCTKKSVSQPWALRDGRDDAWSA